MLGISRGSVCSGSQFRPYRFSAFWLRSSVVSVLISLISDTSPIWGLHIKRIFGLGSRNRGLLHSLHASTRHCSAAGNGAPLLFCSKKEDKAQERRAFLGASVKTGGFSLFGGKFRRPAGAKRWPRTHRSVARSRSARWSVRPWYSGERWRCRKEARRQQSGQCGVCT